ncbi:TIGR00153 family protein [Myxococcota bacterium]|nr:TIGR00153 family protein [Myxococcota bacterium]
MPSILGIFGRPPFHDFKNHMEKVAATVSALNPVFEALFAGEQDKLCKAVKTVSLLEHEADVIKNSLRNQMPRSLFLPVDRRDFLDMLTKQDDIADTAEDVAVALTLRPMTVYPYLKDELQTLVGLSYECVDYASKISREFDNLLEAGFRGPARKRVIKLIDELSHHEHLADKEQDKLMKAVFAHEDELKPAELMQWPFIITELGNIPNTAERFANRVRLIIAR